VKELKALELPLDDNYFIINTNVSELGCGAILKQKSHKYSSKLEKKICIYASGKYKLKAINNTNREILAIINAINTFRLYLGFKEFTVRTNYEAICKYYNKINSKKRFK
jgi:hypothetical protein